MAFKIGDRVRAVIDRSAGLNNGELGTVIGWDVWNEPLIYWDEFNPERHSSYGNVSDGHGWFIGKDWIELVEECSDLGELPEIEAPDMTKFLFDT